jgi:hypothetical protein
MKNPEKNTKLRLYIKYETHHFPVIREGIFLGSTRKTRGEESGLAYRMMVMRQGDVLGGAVLIDDARRNYEASYFKRNVISMCRRD